jgi:hypothetical protein
MENENATVDERIIRETAEVKASLLDDLLLFTQTFYKLRTGRDFKITWPISRESHYLVIGRALDRVFEGKCTNLLINVPPRYGKSSLLINWVAWCMARYPDSNFLYVSVSAELATKATAEIREIMTTPYYRNMFHVELRGDSQAKDNFTTTAGGTVLGLGSGATIVGSGAGLRGVERFGGAIVLDDLMKPSEATSQTIREGIQDWYYNTLISRKNGGVKTPTVFLGQRLHEYDLAAHLLAEPEWESVVLKAIDDSGNALCPALHTIQDLRRLQEQQPYVFNAQFQQSPSGEGSSLFKAENFPILDTEPNLLMTFLTVDTAETIKQINDATVFSLWGVYEIIHFDKPTGRYALHWLNCVEIFVEPKDLQAEFMQFYAAACKFKLPSFAAIEKKSTGVTLVSVLSTIQGLNIISVDRTSKSGSKTDRHLSMQQYITQKLITFPYGAQHVRMCIDHMTKINAAGTQRRSDICDSCFDAVRMVYQDKTALHFIANTKVSQEQSKSIMRNQLLQNTQRAERWD